MRSTPDLDRIGKANHRRISRLAYEPLPRRPMGAFASTNQGISHYMGKLMAKHLLEAGRIFLQ